MYAVIRTGGKQYRVAQGDRFNVERLPGDVGATVTLSDVLALGEGSGLKLGTPVISGASVEAKIIAQARAKKILVFKFKRRKGYKKQRGHRQYFTRLEITQING